MSEGEEAKMRGEGRGQNGGARFSLQKFDLSYRLRGEELRERERGRSEKETCHRRLLKPSSPRYHSLNLTIAKFYNWHESDKGKSKKKSEKEGN